MSSWYASPNRVSSYGYSLLLRQQQPLAARALDSQTRIRQFVNAEIDECQPCTENGHAETCRNKLPPFADDERRVILRPVQYFSPACLGGITKPKKFQRNLGPNHVDKGTDEGRGNQRKFIG